jgi:hypothetical protein
MPSPECAAVQTRRPREPARSDQSDPDRTVRTPLFRSDRPNLNTSEPFDLDSTAQIRSRVPLQLWQFC